MTRPSRRLDPARGTRPAVPVLFACLWLGFAPGPAWAEDEPAAPPSQSERTDRPERGPCGADEQLCRAAEGSSWCCPHQSTGAHVCCGAIEGICHACDVEELPDHAPLAPE